MTLLCKGKIITLTHLLSHTGGLSVSGFPGYEKGKRIPTIPQILDGSEPANTSAVRSIKEPGKEVIYSGGGTTISQLILSDVTKQPYDEFMQENVLDPLGMTSSSFTQPPLASKEKITGNRVPDGWKRNQREISCLSRAGSGRIMDYPIRSVSVYYRDTACI